LNRSTTRKVVGFGEAGCPLGVFPKTPRYDFPAAALTLPANHKIRILEGLRPFKPACVGDRISRVILTLASGTGNQWYTLAYSAKSQTHL
jgi:hypothetical protein